MKTSHITLDELVHQLFILAVSGIFNKTRYTEESLRDFIWGFLRPDARPERLTLPNSLVLSIRLQSGDWYFLVQVLSDGTFSYEIPTTREQEKLLVNALINNLFNKYDEEVKP